MNKSAAPLRQLCRSRLYPTSWSCLCVPLAVSSRQDPLSATMPCVAEVAFAFALLFVFIAVCLACQSSQVNFCARATRLQVLVWFTAPFRDLHSPFVSTSITHTRTRTHKHSLWMTRSGGSAVNLPARLVLGALSWLYNAVYMLWLVSNNWLNKRRPFRSGSAKLLHKICIIGDGHGYGYGDWVAPSMQSGLAYHLMMEMETNGKMRHNWYVLNCGVYGSTSSDWLPLNDDGETAQEVAAREAEAEEQKKREDEASKPKTKKEIEAIIKSSQLRQRHASKSLPTDNSDSTSADVSTKDATEDEQAKAAAEKPVAPKPLGLLNKVLSSPETADAEIFVIMLGSEDCNPVEYAPAMFGGLGSDKVALANVHGGHQILPSTTFKNIVTIAEHLEKLGKRVVVTSVPNPEDWIRLRYKKDQEQKAKDAESTALTTNQRQQQSQKLLEKLPPRTASRLKKAERLTKQQAPEEASESTTTKNDSTESDWIETLPNGQPRLDGSLRTLSFKQMLNAKLVAHFEEKERQRMELPQPQRSDPRVRFGPRLDLSNYEYDRSDFYSAGHRHFNWRGYKRVAKDVHEMIQADITRIEFLSILG
ncbi:hypothetical protein GQ42DRAFT_27542 [Ramicandelaber brevisporus]|nr:hypothetical protein GQ42DRAFT_27542 [Ramicandelaber brevisporus]